eukprot:c16168_g1_i6.p2 GENE.c16168_g1_i6~~c16168_g1_i6.p2  ORF type:complete len:110 (-),score=4.58 c16168_g1_i6:914-1243(-)
MLNDSSTDLSTGSQFELRRTTCLGLGGNPNLLYFGCGMPVSALRPERPCNLCGHVVSDSNEWAFCSEHLECLTYETLEFRTNSKIACLTVLMRAGDGTPKKTDVFSGCT